MNKYICIECGETFDFPNTYQERHPYGDTFVSEEFGCCPTCGSADFETAKPCSICGEPIPASSLYGLCDVCEAVADQSLAEFIVGLDPAARHYLDDHRCGGWLKTALEEIDK